MNRDGTDGPTVVFWAAFVVCAGALVVSGAFVAAVTRVVGIFGGFAVCAVVGFMETVGVEGMVANAETTVGTVVRSVGITVSVGFINSVGAVLSAVG